MKKMIILCSALVLSALLTINARAEIRIAFVDLEKAFEDYDVAKKYRKDLEKKQKNMEKEIEGKERKLKSNYEDLIKQKTIMSKSVYEKKEKELWEGLQLLRKDAVDSSQKLINEGKDFTKKVLKDIYDVAKKIALKENFNYVFEKSSLLFGGEDITDKVIKELNKNKR